MARELLSSGYRLLCPVRDGNALAVQRLKYFAHEKPVVSRNTDAGKTVEASPDAARASSPKPASNLTLIEVDLTDMEATAAALADVKADAVVSCLASRTGSPQDSERVEYAANRHLLTWAKDGGASHFTLLSAICVQKPRLAFQFEKLRFEEELAASGIPSAIVRPTAFFKSLSGQLERVQAGKPFLVFGRGFLTQCKPIAESDLARYLRRTLEDRALRGVLPLGGPGPALSPRDQADLLAELIGRPVRVRSVPPRLLSAAARFFDLLSVFSRRCADKAEFARIGHYYATESMLVWDESTRAYSDELTPEFGSITLRDSYKAQLAGEELQELGDHAMFH